MRKFQIRIFCAFALLLGLHFGQNAFAQGWLPPVVPSYTVTANGDVGSDYLFVGAYAYFQPSPKLPANMLMNKDGELIWYSSGSTYLYDYKIHPNGLMSYYLDGQFYILDSTFNYVDTIRGRNGYTDPHELYIDSIGHIWIITLTWRDSIDLSSLTTTTGQAGDVYGQVEESKIQEFDANGNFIKEWKGFDHYSINDMDMAYFRDRSYLPLQHTNSIDVRNGQVLISNRNMNDVTLIDWATGDVIWRLGGVSSSFTFVNDTLQFDSQHDARFLDNDRISIFDNGSTRNVEIARGVIYRLDTAAWTATQVWDHSQAIDSKALGSMRFRDDSVRIINWGNVDNAPAGIVDFVDPAGNTRWSIEFQNGMGTYRAQPGEIPWDIPYPELECHDSLGYTVLSVKSNHTRFYWSNGENTSSIAVQDTGSYFAFVDFGVGHIRTETFRLLDSQVPCNGVPILDPVQQEATLEAVYDLYGRKVTHRVSGQVYIEVYSDGSRKKVAFFE